jgi:archaemetzincin
VKAGGLKGELLLQPIGAVDPVLIEYLAMTTGEALERATRIAPEALAPDFAYDAVRRQVHSTKLLERLEAGKAEGEPKVLGVADADLFIPIFTFVFGEARLGGRAAVVSIARLRPQFYGQPESRRVLFERAEKEAMHELGHVHGLVHCRDFSCVMHFSNSVEEVDVKGEAFCPRCRERLG